MIVAVLLDLVNYERYQLGWAYYHFCCRCKENGWGLAVQERFYEWEPKSKREWDEIYGGSKVWNYNVPNARDIEKVKKFIIPEEIFEDLRNQQGSWVGEALWLLRHRYEPFPCTLR